MKPGGLREMHGKAGVTQSWNEKATPPAGHGVAH